jgi:hypothetical protein
MKLSVKAWTRRTSIFVVTFVMGISGMAQINSTLYFMHGIPQANRINPAYQPRCGLYLGLPLVSPVRGGFSFSSQSYEDVIQRHPTEDSLITFLHPLADREPYLDHLKPVNLVASNLATSLASLGFRTKVGFFSLGVATRLDGTLTYPADLINLLVDGAEEGRTYTLDGLGANLSMFEEISVGWAGSLSDRLDIGARAKVLLGVGNLYTSRSEVSLYTSQESWNVKSDLLINASLGFAEVVYNEEGLIEEVKIDEEIRNLTPYEIGRVAFGSGNYGFGVDLGAVFRPLDQLSLDISVVDLAYIRWKQEVHQVSFKGEYEFTGIEFNPFGLAEDVTFGDYLDSTLSQMADSLSGFLTMGPGPPYSKRLNTKLYVGASYEIAPMLSFGLLSRTEFRKGITTEHVTASANFSTGRLINLSLSYSYMHSSFRNIGAGFAFNVGPLNLYMVSDNLLNLIFWPQASRAVNLWLGMNLVFGYKSFMQGVERDRPLVY